VDTLNGRANQEVRGGEVCYNSPETLVSYQKTTPDKNPKDFIQHYDHGGSLQSHTFCWFGIPAKISSLISEVTPSEDYI
jgi:hypothetical protein